jgi:hypothetical protein
LLTVSKSIHTARFDVPFDPAFDERLRESEVRKVSTAATMTYTSHDNDFLLFTDAPEAGLNVLLVSDSCQVGAQVRSYHLAVPYGLLFSTSSSRLLLCDSNYCMQVLCAPDTAELDRAHAQRYWFPICVPNVCNLKRIAPKRKLTWVLLGISSAPLHLLFNWVVFANLQAKEYTVIPTTEDWLHGSAYDTSSFLNFTDNAKKTFATKMETYRFDISEQVMLNDGTESPEYSNISTNVQRYPNDTAWTGSNITNILDFLEAEGRLPHSYLDLNKNISIAPPIGVRCQVTSSLGTAQLYQTRSVFRYFVETPEPPMNWSTMEYATPHLGKVPGSILSLKYHKILQLTPRRRSYSRTVSSTRALSSHKCSWDLSC